MEVNILEIKDGVDPTRATEAPPNVAVPKLDVSGKKKRRRGKSKRKIMKRKVMTFMKAPWHDRRKNAKRNNFRKIVLAKTHAPFNNNQFLMEIHKPEPENNFHILQTPSARTRDSSFSIDSEDNYFFSLPEDEEEYLAKEFSSVYEDAQSERLSNMSKNDLIQEYLLLEAKYDNLVKRNDHAKPRYVEEDKDSTNTERDTSATYRDSTMTDRDTSVTYVESSIADEPSIEVLLQRMKDQENQIRELQISNEKLKLENDHLRKRSHDSSSEDSESDSSSSSGSSSSSNSSQNRSHVVAPAVTEIEDVQHLQNHHNGQNGIADDLEPSPTYPLVNGFHNPNE